MLGFRTAFDGGEPSQGEVRLLTGTCNRLTQLLGLTVEVRKGPAAQTQDMTLMGFPLNFHSEERLLLKT